MSVPYVIIVFLSLVLLYTLIRTLTTIAKLKTSLLKNEAIINSLHTQTEGLRSRVAELRIQVVNQGLDKVLDATPQTKQLILDRDIALKELAKSQQKVRYILGQAYQAQRLLFSADRNKSMAKRKLDALKKQARRAGVSGEIDNLHTRKQ